ncbi:TonB-dependent receptor, partial [Acinetobacter baumannii]
WANYSEGFELPDPAKYYGQGDYQLNGGMAGHWQLVRSINVAASPLTGIKTRQLEAGWRHQQDGVKAQAAVFYALSDKSITYDRTSLTINVLDQDKRNYGLEGELSWLSPKGIELGSNALVIRSQVKAGGSWNRQD